jgi:tetratricopeptide (TPR) repeat protein
VALLNAGQLGESARALAQALDLAPGNPAALYAFGQLEERRGSLEAAQRYYRLVVENPGEGGYGDRARDKLSAGRLQAALQGRDKAE